MHEFNQQLLSCYQAAYPDSGKRLVFGEGRSEHPPVMLIGEAPGGQEEEQGRPFVGKAGQNLSAFLKVLELRREDIYISNVVKLRPSKVSDKGRVSNRPPNREELAFFTPHLHREIAKVQPGMIVTLGNVALQAVTGTKAVIGDMHGQVAQVMLDGQNYRLFPLYHPASIIYNRALKEVYDADLAALKRELQLSS